MRSLSFQSRILGRSRFQENWKTVPTIPLKTSLSRSNYGCTTLRLPSCQIWTPFVVVSYQWYTSPYAECPTITRVRHFYMKRMYSNSLPLTVSADPVSASLITSPPTGKSRLDEQYLYFWQAWVYPKSRTPSYDSSVVIIHNVWKICIRRRWRYTVVINSLGSLY